MKLQIIAAISAVLIFASAVFAQERYLKPVDEGSQDASFVSFRTKLINAAKAKDAGYIRSILDPAITVDFGGGRSVSAFLKQWSNLNPKSDFWGEFLAVISNGGVFERETGKSQKQFWAPYTFRAFPEDLDSFATAAIFGKDVNLRKAPRTDAEVITRLSYNLVKVDGENSVRKTGDNEKLEWVKIETFGGKSGYVNASYVRSSVDYRACFEKKRGKWVMTIFVAGD